MNLTTILSIATLLSSCHAFTPNHNVLSTSTTSLYAQSLEGWKIDGLIKPVNNFILIEKAEEQTKSDSGILFSKSVSVTLSTEFCKYPFVYVRCLLIDWICNVP